VQYPQLSNDKLSLFSPQGTIHVMIKIGQKGLKKTTFFPDQTHKYETPSFIGENCIYHDILVEPAF